MIRSCPACSAKNRIPAARLLDAPKCGKCKAGLPPPSTPIPLDTGYDFNLLINESPLPVLVDFWAVWCGPCKSMAPELDKLAAKKAGQLVVGKVDTDKVPALASQFNIQSIPTLILFRGGEEVSRVTGAASAASLEKQLGLSQT